VLVLAAGAVRAAAATQAELALHEMGLELVPFGGGRFAVLLGGPNDATLLDERAAVPDDVLGVDRCVALGGRQAGVPHQDLDDVGRQTAAECLGGEDASEVVRGEPHRDATQPQLRL
jgi:hypothetical protein